MTTDEKKAILEAAGYTFSVSDFGWYLEAETKTPDNWYRGEISHLKTEGEVEPEKAALWIAIIDTAWQHYQAQKRIELLEEIIYRFTRAVDFYRDGMDIGIYNEIVEKYKDRP